MVTYKTRVMNWVSELVNACKFYPEPLEELPMTKIEKTVIIMWGWPGSGKSTLTRAILEHYSNGAVGIDCHYIENIRIVSADKYHVDPLTGKYQWHPDNVAFSHQACRRSYAEGVAWGKTLLIVDNTNIRRKEYSYYVALAREYDYTVLQAIPNNKGMWDIDECFKRNVHNVPRETIQRMRDSFEDDPELERFVLPSYRKIDIESAVSFRDESAKVSR